MRRETTRRESPADWRGAGAVTRFPTVQWSCADREALCDGWLITRSGRGFAMATQHGAAPDCGDAVRVLFMSRAGSGFLEAYVTRVESLSDTLDLVTANFTTPAPGDFFSSELQRTPS